MGNKRAREFQKRSEDEAAWLLAKTQRRHFFIDVFAPGIGERRTTIIHCPSFVQSFAWDIRELDGEFKLYRSEVCSRHTTIGYEEVKYSSDELSSFINRLESCVIPVSPQGGFGCDGTTIHMGLYSGSSGIQLSWWEDVQKEWKQVGGIVNEMIVSFSNSQPEGEQDVAGDSVHELVSGQNHPQK